MAWVTRPALGPAVRCPILGDAVLAGQDRGYDLDAGEITDKGYVNQRTVLARRAALVDLLYTDPVPDGVVVAGQAPGDPGLTLEGAAPDRHVR